MARNIEGNILVFDIEGTDSKERGEQRLVLFFIYILNLGSYLFCRLLNKLQDCLL